MTGIFDGKTLQQIQEESHKKEVERFKARQKEAARIREQAREAKESITPGEAVRQKAESLGQFIEKMEPGTPYINTQTKAALKELHEIVIYLLEQTAEKKPGRKPKE